MGTASASELSDCSGILNLDQQTRQDMPRVTVWLDCGSGSKTSGSPEDLTKCFVLLTHLRDRISFLCSEKLLVEGAMEQEKQLRRGDT